jgi:hypothetical protein
VTQRTPRDNEHEVEAAEREAAAALGEGWEFELPDYERFRLPGALVEVYAVAAHRQERELALVVVVGKANAFRQLVRRVRGDLEVTPAWALPLPFLEPKRRGEFLGPYNENDEQVVAALRDLQQALPDGWQLYELDRERFRVGGRKLETFAVSAVGAGGDGALVLAVGEASAYRHLERRLRGELEVTDAWAPPLDLAR